MLRKKKAPLSEILRWERVSGYPHASYFSNFGNRLEIIRHSVHAGNILKGRRIVFFSDLHWKGYDGLMDSLRTLISHENPDWLVFGGDLVTYSCFHDDAMRFMESLHANYAKIAVLGNWDRKRWKWQNVKMWSDDYAAAGFNLLLNNEFLSNGIRFYGAEEPRKGLNFLGFTNGTSVFNCLVSHVFDSILDREPDEILNSFKLILTGHTHAGQLRIPFFGALKTSSKYWKLFEYGLYHHKKRGCDLVVSSGVGTSWLPVRFLCRPEIVSIDFK